MKRQGFIMRGRRRLPTMLERIEEASFNVYSGAALEEIKSGMRMYRFFRGILDEVPVYRNWGFPEVGIVE